jgi:type I restriction enzyme, S subunit
MSEENKLPKGWIEETISKIGKVKGGKRLPKGHNYSENKTPFPYIRVTDFENLTIGQDKLKYLLPETQALIKNYTISKDDVYISIAGTIGEVGVIPETLDGANLTENAAKITELIATNNKYLANYLSSKTSQTQIAEHTIATTQPKLSLFRIDKIIVPIPPLPEQHRIVAKIEELFSDLDKGMEYLKIAQAQLKVYRQAVLKWAFEGRLTNEGLKDGELPEGWDVFSVGDICKSIVPNRDKPRSFSGNIKWVTTPNFVPGSIKLNHKEMIMGLTEDEVIMYKAKVIPVDSVIMTCVGTFGLSAVVDKPIVINQQLHAFLQSERMNPKYLAYCIQSNKNYFEHKSTSTTIQYLNKENCNSMPIPLCSVQEQGIIVSEIESRLSVCDKIEESITQSLLQADALRQSILKKAFEGKLVPQDPNDEPASVLLERIRKERATSFAEKATAAERRKKEKTKMN